MRRKIPSNAALMAFEAAARHGSFARAAGELALTEGAISRQIGRLEAFLGVTLFERIGNRVRLRPNGERYATQVRQSLDRLERDSQYVMGQPSDGTSIELAILPTFATRWLIPRLKGFQLAHPRITVHLAERMEPFILANSGFDAAIHFDHPAWTGMHKIPLLKERLVPVCHPSLVEEQEGRPLLEDLPRLHRRQNPNAWHDYATEIGVTLSNPAMGPRYDLHGMLIEAALAGLGVALVPRFYVEKDLAEGRLVAPWPDGTSISKTFSLISPEPIRLSQVPLQVFANWLSCEASA